VGNSEVGCRPAVGGLLRPGGRRARTRTCPEAA